MKKNLCVAAILFALRSTTFVQENDGGKHHINIFDDNENFVKEEK